MPGERDQGVAVRGTKKSVDRESDLLFNTPGLLESETRQVPARGVQGVCQCIGCYVKSERGGNPARALDNRPRAEENVPCSLRVRVLLLGGRPGLPRKVVQARRNQHA
jgi:hypothetical protein